MSDADSNFYLQEKDIYDLAYDTAQEFDKIISFLDSEQITPLINKVINILELLEQSVKKIEHLEKENSDFKSKCLQLTDEKAANEEEKINVKLAFEELEESWAQECMALKAFINKLKAENKLLQDSLAEKNDISLEIGSSYKVIIEDQEKLISKLKANLKQKDNQLEKHGVNIEALKSKVEHLSTVNKALHIQCRHAKNQVATSNAEKSDFEAKLCLQKKEMYSLEYRFHALKKCLIEKNENLTKCQGETSKDKNYLSEDTLNMLLQEQHELKQKVSNLQLELVSVKNQNEEFKKKLHTETQNTKLVAEGGRIQQIFRLFLGVININNGTCWFRAI